MVKMIVTQKANQNDGPNPKKIRCKYKKSLTCIKKNCAINLYSTETTKKREIYLMLFVLKPL